MPSLPYSMDEALPQRAAALFRGVADTLNDGEVVVCPCFVLHRGWEGVIVPLPVVRSVFEVELLAYRGGGYCNEPNSVGTGDSLRAEVCATVEPVVDTSAPTGTYGGVSVDIDGGEALCGEGFRFVLVRPNIADVILWVIHPLFGAAGATVVEDSGAHRDRAEAEDAPACVRYVRDPQPERETAAPVEGVCIVSRRGRGQGGGLANACEVPAVGGVRCRGRG